MLKLNSAIIDRINTMKDRSLKITLVTPELSAVEMSDLFTAHLESKQGVEIGEINLEDIKSPAQRLKACLWRLWELTNKSEEFEVFYRRRMDRIINGVKENLP